MSRPQPAYTHGLAAFSAGSYDTAIDLFTQAIDRDPSNPKYFDARASAYDRLGKLQLALLDAKTVIQLVPTSARGYLRAAKLLKRAEKYANAEKVVKQGLAHVSKKDEKGIANLEMERDLLENLRTQAEFCPFATIPLEIVVEIIALATVPPPTSRYTNEEISRARAPRTNPLVTMMRVCRSWGRIIKGSPRLWQTLRLDGVINSRSSAMKTRLYLQRAMGLRDDPSNGRNGIKSLIRHTSLDGATTARGVQRVFLTAAQDLPSPAFSSILEQLRAAGVASTLREVVLSFVDGSRTTLSNERESAVATELLEFLHNYSRTCLTSLTICTAGRCYPAFDLASIYVAFPRLETFKIWGSTTSTFVSNLRAPFLRSEAGDDDDNGEEEEEELRRMTSLTPTNARSLAVSGTVLVADRALRASQFPRLESLELDLIGRHVVWDLLSVPNLSKFRVVLSGGELPPNLHPDLPVPDLAASWAKVQDLKIGGHKQLAGYLLGHAIELRLGFRHLTTLDLSHSTLTTRHLALFDSSADRAPNLESLSLASTTTVAQQQLELPQLDALRSLDVSHTLWANDDTVRTLVKKCPRLDRLAIVGNAFVTGRPIMELVLARKQQRHRPPPPPPPEQLRGDDDQDDVIKDGDGDHVDDNGTGRGVARLSEMSELKLEGCDKLETAAVEWLRKNTRPGVVKVQFLDPVDRRKGRWERRA